MAKKKKKRRNTTAQNPPQRTRWLWAVVGVAIVLAVSGVTIVLTANNAQIEDGTPELVVDRTVIDEGYQKLDSTVRTSFTLRNEGDATLRILGEPQVELVEGC